MSKAHKELLKSTRVRSSAWNARKDRFIRLERENIPVRVVKRLLEFNLLERDEKKSHANQNDKSLLTKKKFVSEVK